MTRRSRIFMLCAAAALAGCSASEQAREVEATSGFLGDAYPLLKKGEVDEALLVYRKDGVNWASYHQIRLAPVTFWIGRDSEMENLPPADRQKLANRFYALVHDELSKDYELVTTPSAGALDLQIALTEAEKSDPALDTVSTIVPQALVMSSLTGMITGKPAFVGEAQAEAKVFDGGDGELLAAAVDRRVGGKDISGAMDSWGDVDAAMQHWAQQIRYRLCHLRGANDCAPPS